MPFTKEYAIARGWPFGGGQTQPTPPIVPPVVTLAAALGVSPLTFQAAAAEDTLIANISGRTVGSSLSILPNDGTVKFNGAQTQLLVGPSASGSGSKNYTIYETLAGAVGSPRATLVTIVVTSGALAAPSNTVAPAITGTTTVGSILTGTDGSWSNSPTAYAAQWTRDGTDIPGEIFSTYLLADADVGKVIARRVTATNATGSTPATSSGTAAVRAWRAVAAGGIVYPDAAQAASTNQLQDVKHWVVRSTTDTIEILVPGAWVNTTVTGAQDMVQGREVPIGNDFGVKAWIEAGGVKYPFLFSGSATGTVPGTTGDWLRSDPLALALTPGTAIAIYTHYNPAGANVALPIVSNLSNTNSVLNTADGDSCRHQATPTAGFPNTVGADDNSGRRTTGGTIIGLTTDEAVLIVGDSISGHGKETPPNLGLIGPDARCLGGSVSLMNGTVGGDWVMTAAYNFTKRGYLIQFCSMVLPALGTNDTLGRVSPWLGVKPHWRKLLRLFTGKKLLCKTVYPYPTGITGAESDVTKQTANTNDTLGRVAMNTDIRASLDGVPFYEAAGIIETSLNSGKVITSQGQITFEIVGTMLHPNRAGALYIVSQMSAPTMLGQFARCTVPESSYDLTLSGATYGATGFGTGLSAGYGSVYGAMPTTFPFTWEVAIKGGTAAFGYCLHAGPITVWVNATGKMEVRLNGAIALTSSTTVTDGTDHVVRLSCHSNAQQLLIDGALEASSSVTFSAASAFATLLGIRTSYTALNSQKYDGTMSYVALYNVAKDGTYTPTGAKPVGNEAGLWLYWPLTNSGVAIKGPAFPA